MTERTLWEDIWDRLNPKLAEVAEDLRRRNPELWWWAEHHESGAFPFSAVASFGAAGIPGDADVVLSFSVRRDGHDLEVVSDIATEEGEVLAETSPVAVDTRQPDEAVARALDACLADFERLVEANLDELRRRVRRPA